MSQRKLPWKINPQKYPLYLDCKLGAFQRSKVCNTLLQTPQDYWKNVLTIQRNVLRLFIPWWKYAFFKTVELINLLSSMLLILLGLIAVVFLNYRTQYFKRCYTKFVNMCLAILLENEFDHFNNMLEQYVSSLRNHEICTQIYYMY